MIAHTGTELVGSEEMPAGQTPVTVTVVSHNDLVDAVQPGDRYVVSERG